MQSQDSTKTRKKYFRAMVVCVLIAVLIGVTIFLILNNTREDPPDDTGGGGESADSSTPGNLIYALIGGVLGLGALSTGAYFYIRRNRTEKDLGENETVPPPLVKQDQELPPPPPPVPKRLSKPVPPPLPPRKKSKRNSSVSEVNEEKVREKVEQMKQKILAIGQGLALSAQKDIEEGENKWDQAMKKLKEYVKKNTKLMSEVDKSEADLFLKEKEAEETKRREQSVDLT